MPPKTTKQHSKQQSPSLVQDPEQQASEMTEDELTTDANASKVVSTSVLQSVQVDCGKRFDIVLAEIKAARCDIQLLANRVALAEDRIGTNEDDIAAVKATNTTLETKLETLTRKVEELENNSRRNNIRLVGLREGEEGTDMCEFLTKWIPKVLGIQSFPEPTVIERAHIIGRPRDVSKSTVNPIRPREVLMKFLKSADKVRVLRIARQKGSVLYEGKRVMFFPDFSVELRKQRRLFDPVKNHTSHPGPPFWHYLPIKDVDNLSRGPACFC